MTLASKIEANAEIAFAEFKRKELENDKYQVFDNAYKISGMTCLYEYLVSGEISNFDDKDLEILDEHGRHLLAILYDEDMDRENASLDNWNDIEDLISDFIEREKGE